MKSEFGRREERLLFSIKDTFQQHLIFFFNVVVQVFFNLREFSDNISHSHKTPVAGPYFLKDPLGLLPRSSIDSKDGPACPSLDASPIHSSRPTS